LRFADIESRYGIRFEDYFKHELPQLAALERDKLVELQADHLCVTPSGRYLLRAIAMPFDAYLRDAVSAANEPGPRYSRVI
jgi:oxygen-independent coproporphyrinogen-3 oxidase